MRLFIVDDNIEFRERLALILSNLKGIDVVGQAGDVPEAISSIVVSEPDGVLVDIHTPGGNGADVLCAIKAMSPPPIVIMLTAGRKRAHEKKSFARNVDYYFEKSRELQEMISVLKKMAQKSATEKT